LRSGGGYAALLKQQVKLIVAITRSFENQATITQMLMLHVAFRPTGRGHN
jgi:hypothetical protein